MEEAAISGEHPLWALVIEAREVFNRTMPTKFATTVALTHILDMNTTASPDERVSRSNAQARLGQALATLDQYPADSHPRVLQHAR